MSERITWETCPRCGTLAALAWRGGTLVDVDCPGECAITSVDFDRRTPRRTTFQFPAPVAPRRAGAEAGPSKPPSELSPLDGPVPS